MKKIILIVIIGLINVTLFTAIYKYYISLSDKVILNLEYMKLKDYNELLIQKGKQEAFNYYSKDWLELFCSTADKKSKLNKDEYQKYLYSRIINMKKKDNKVLSYPNFKYDLIDHKIYFRWPHEIRVYRDKNNKYYIFANLGDSLYLEDTWYLQNERWCILYNNPGRITPKSECPIKEHIKLKCSKKEDGGYYNCSCK